MISAINGIEVFLSRVDTIYYISSSKFRSFDARAETKEGRNFTWFFLKALFVKDTRVGGEGEEGKIFLVDVTGISTYNFYTRFVSLREYFGRHRAPLFRLRSLVRLLEVFLILLRELSMVARFLRVSSWRQNSLSSFFFLRIWDTVDNTNRKQLVHVIITDTIENKNRTHLGKFILIKKYKNIYL